MKNIWVVEGHAGDYDPRINWHVRAFGEEEEARAFYKQCQEVYETAREQDGWDPEFWEHPLDPEFEEIHSVKTWYTCHKVPFGPIEEE